MEHLPKPPPLQLARKDEVDALVDVKMSIHKDCCGFRLQKRETLKSQADHRLAFLDGMANSSSDCLRYDFMNDEKVDTLEEIALTIAFNQVILHMGGPEIFIESMRDPIKHQLALKLSDLKKTTREFKNGETSLDDAMCELMSEMRGKISEMTEENRNLALKKFDEEMQMLGIKDY